MSNTCQEGLGINLELVNAIISKLDVFEKEKKYLTKDISLPKLAEMFDSNIVYVSKIISHHKNKKSVDYINDLRVGYIVEMLDSSSKFRNYTNKALGEEAGFSTTQNFTRAFGKTMGMSPTDYILKVNKKFKIWKDFNFNIFLSQLVIDLWFLILKPAHFCFILNKSFWYEAENGSILYLRDSIDLSLRYLGFDTENSRMDKLPKLPFPETAFITLSFRLL